MLGRTPDEIIAVRPLKDGVIADFEVTEDLLREFIQKVAEAQVPGAARASSSACPRASPRSRSARCSTRRSAPARARCCSSPSRSPPRSASASRSTSPTGNMVVDIGGGTTEIAVIALNGIVTKTRRSASAATRWTRRSSNYAKKAYNMLIGEQTAERIKIEIGSAFPLARGAGHGDQGARPGARHPAHAARSPRVEIREALQEPIGRSSNALRESLEQTPPELAADIVDRGIFMTGGGALLRGLDLLLREVTNLTITRRRGSAARASCSARARSSRIRSSTKRC